MLERAAVRNVVHNHGTHCVAVIGGSERLKPLLPCSVPDLRLQSAISDSNGLGREFKANGLHTMRHVFVLGEAHDEV